MAKHNVLNLFWSIRQIVAGVRSLPFLSTAAFLCGLVALAPGKASAVTDVENQAAEAKKKAIRDAVLRSHNGVESLDVSYRVFNRADTPDRPVWYASTRAAIKGSRRFLEAVHFSDSQPPELDLNHGWTYFTGDEYSVFYVNGRYYETSKRNAKLHFAWKLRAERYIMMSGWWPNADDRPPPDLLSVPFTPLRYVVADDGYRLAATTELIHGCACLVLEKAGHDKVWLDVEKGYAVRRRERCNPDTGTLVARVDCFDFRCYHSDGAIIWLPWRIETVRFNQPADGVAASGKYTTDVTQVTALTVNDVSDDVFVFIPPPGTLIQDRDTGRYTQIPGGRDVLDHSARIGGEIVRRAAPDHVIPRYNLRTGVLLGTCIVIALNVWLSLRLWFSGRHPNLGDGAITLINVDEGYEQVTGAMASESIPASDCGLG